MMTPIEQELHDLEEVTKEVVKHVEKERQRGVANAGVPFDLHAQLKVLKLINYIRHQADVIAAKDQALKSFLSNIDAGFTTYKKDYEEVIAIKARNTLEVV